MDEILNYSFLEPFGQFQPNVTQSTLFQGEIAKIHLRNLKRFFSRTTWPISTKLRTKHPWVRRIQVFSIKDHSLFQGEIIAKIHWRNLKLYFSRTNGPISTKLRHKASLSEIRELNFFLQIWNIQISKEDNVFSLLLTLWYNHSLAQMCLLMGTVSQVSDMAHRPFIFFLRLYPKDLDVRCWQIFDITE